MEKQVKIALLLDLYGNLLTEKQYNLLNDYYNNDFSLSEIAENEGITRQAVRDNLLKGENNLLEYDEKLSILKKKTRDQNILDNSIEELNSIINDRKIDSEAIKIIKNVIRELKKID